MISRAESAWFVTRHSQLGVHLCPVGSYDNLVKHAFFDVGNVAIRHRTLTIDSPLIRTFIHHVEERRRAERGLP